MFLRPPLLVWFAPDDPPAAGGGAAAAPPAPAATAGPPLTAVEAATAAARTAIATSGSALPPEEPAHPSARQPRTEGGEFAASTAVNELGEPPAAAAAAPAPAAAEEPAAPAPAEGEQPPAAAAEGEPPATEEEPNPLVVELPGRNPGETLPIEVEDQDTADRLRQLANGYMRGEEAREYVAAEAQRTEELRGHYESYLDAVVADPGGVVLDELEGDPEALDHLVLYTLTRPDVWKRVGERVLQLADPNTLRLTAAEQAVERTNFQRDRATAGETRRAVRENLTQVQAVVGRMIPAELAAGQRTSLYSSCLNVLRDYAETHRLVTLDVDHVPAILARTLQQAGVDPVAAAAAAFAPAKKTAAPPAPAAAAAPAPAAAGAGKGGAAAPARTGKEYVARAARLRTGAIPAAGAGSPPAPAATPPPGMGIEEAVKWHRGRLAKGQRS
jgi:hypothetical protein